MYREGMRRRCVRAVLPLAAAVLVPACASTHTVSLRVTDESGRPVRGAAIIAIPIATSDVPLPLTSQVLSELLAKDATKTSGVTDARGDARLTLFEHPTAIRVSPPAFDPLADSGVAWLYTLDPTTGRLEPPSDRANPPGLNVGVAR